MKTRQGFVSNSSSSSFVILLDKETHTEACKKLKPMYAAAIDLIPEHTHNKIVFDKKMIVIEWHTGNASECNCFEGTEEFKETWKKELRAAAVADWKRWEKNKPCPEDRMASAYETVDEALDKLQEVLKDNYKDQYFSWDVDY